MQRHQNNEINPEDDIDIFGILWEFDKRAKNSKNLRREELRDTLLIVENLKVEESQKKRQRKVKRSPIDDAKKKLKHEEQFTI